MVRRGRMFGRGDAGSQARTSRVSSQETEGDSAGSGSLGGGDGTGPADCETTSLGEQRKVRHCIEFSPLQSLRSRFTRNPDAVFEHPTSMDLLASRMPERYPAF